MAEDDDWDLSAIVRSCSVIKRASTCSTTATSNDAESTTKNGGFRNPLDRLAVLSFDDNEANDPFASSNPVHRSRSNGLQELQDSYKPFLLNVNVPNSFGPDRGGFSGSNQLQQLPTCSISVSPRFVQSSPIQVHRQGGSLKSGSNTNVLSLRTVQAQATRSKKKKSHQKRVVERVPADKLSNDVWAWRKYGQKPIKGSPYPRNYYRCSSSKGCGARKQVEKSNNEPNIFIVSYTGDHTHPRPTHRNSLAGSTRNKFPTPQKPLDKESEAPTSDKKAVCSSPSTSLSPTTPLSASMDHEATTNENINTTEVKDHNMDTDNDDDHDGDDHGDILIPNMTLNEDLIKELQELIGSSGHEDGNGSGGNSGPT
ncbi:hypothetical protein K2173_028354 [Erythroxylum novogranatense]|uniref:WRKY domain-containing protein n=1 Tax=Erythroxylum novogranatense TaxID=1862640 RepID=A0AAV8U1K9_9ROSI|nr:hypothetical protein K2173_028354 [Erythroxylum novogranatense]